MSDFWGLVHMALVFSHEKLFAVFRKNRASMSHRRQSHMVSQAMKYDPVFYGWWWDFPVDGIVSFYVWKTSSWQLQVWLRSTYSRLGHPSSPSWLPMVFFGCLQVANIMDTDTFPRWIDTWKTDWTFPLGKWSKNAGFAFCGVANRQKLGVCCSTIMILPISLLCNITIWLLNIAMKNHYVRLGKPSINGPLANWLC